MDVSADTSVSYGEYIDFTIPRGNAKDRFFTLASGRMTLDVQQKDDVVDVAGDPVISRSARRFALPVVRSWSWMRSLAETMTSLLSAAVRTRA